MGSFATIQIKFYVFFGLFLELRSQNFILCICHPVLSLSSYPLILYTAINGMINLIDWSSQRELHGCNGQLLWVFLIKKYFFFLDIFISNLLYFQLVLKKYGMHEYKTNHIKFVGEYDKLHKCSQHRGMYIYVCNCILF